MKEWEKEFSELFNACGEVPEECFIDFIQAQIDKAREETAREIFKELDNVWFVDVLDEPAFEQLKAKYKVGK